MKLKIGSLFLIIILLIAVQATFETGRSFQWPKVFKNEESSEGTQKISFAPVNETEKFNFSKVLSIEDFEHQYLSYKESDLRYEILQIEKDLESRELIKKANEHLLTVDEFQSLAFLLRKKSALHKILMDRTIDQEDEVL